MSSIFNFCYVIGIILLALHLGTAKVAQVSDVTRKIHGSYGAFRDFTPQDCDQPYENKWMRCAGGETNSFIYHWNNQLKGCERAIYKGCGATRNNFITERDCNTQAKPVCSKK